MNTLGRTMLFIAIVLLALAALLFAQLIALFVPIDDGQDLSHLVVAGILRGGA